MMKNTLVENILNIIFEICTLRKLNEALFQALQNGTAKCLHEDFSSNFMQWLSYGRGKWEGSDPHLSRIVFTRFAIRSVLHEGQGRSSVLAMLSDDLRIVISRVDWKVYLERTISPLAILSFSCNPR